MAMNVRKPAFQLLSLFPATIWDNVHPTYADIPCLLPDQLGIYLGVYIPCLLVSLCIVAFAVAIRARRTNHSDREFIAMSPQPTPLPDPATSPNRNQTSVVCFGHRRRLPSALRYLFGCKESGKSPKASKRGLLENVLRDVMDIAVFPIGIFIVVTTFTLL